MPSSVIASYSYSEEDKVLKVIFLSGLIYDYLDVPLAVYQRMKNSLSKVSFLNREIKGKFPFRRVG